MYGHMTRAIPSLCSCFEA